MIPTNDFDPTITVYEVLQFLEDRMERRCAEADKIWAKPNDEYTDADNAKLDSIERYINKDLAAFERVARIAASITRYNAENR